MKSMKGFIFNFFRIKNDNQAVRVEMQVHVLVPCLVSNHPNTTGDFILIDFPPTFIGAMRYETVVVSNKSAQPATFILLAEIRNEVLVSTFKFKLLSLFFYSILTIITISTLGNINFVLIKFKLFKLKRLALR